MKRRIFLQGALSTSATLAALGAGVLSTSKVLAVDFEAFRQKSNELTALLDSAEAGSFKFKAPELAENGGVIPITVDARKMANVERIDVLVIGANTPLSASFKIGEGAQGYASTRIKMAETAEVVALVSANGKLYKKQQQITVTIGGCGG